MAVGLVRVVRVGLSRTAGFGIGILLTGAASLFIIPSLIRASGSGAWAAIAVGQAIGGVGAVILSWGSGVTGPAAVARADRATRMAEYADNLRVRLALVGPVSAIGSLISVVFSHGHAIYAVFGCVTTCWLGLTAIWYFVGTNQPYVLLALETGPKVLGTLVGIFAMTRGASALVGLTAQGLGLVAGFAITAVYVMRWPSSAGPRPQLRRRPVRRVLLDQRHEMSSSIIASIYTTAPILIVSAVAPFSVGAYGVIYKLQRQINSGLSPVTNVLQGWVPRAVPGTMFARARKALLMVIVIGAGTCLFLIVGGTRVIHWLGGGQISVSFAVVVLSAVSVGMATVDSTIGKTCLVPFGLIPIMARITLYGSAAGLSCIALFTWLWGVDGALLGLILGLSVKIGCMSVVFFRSARARDSLLTGGGKHAKL